MPEDPQTLRELETRAVPALDDPSLHLTQYDPLEHNPYALGSDRHTPAGGNVTPENLAVEASSTPAASEAAHQAATREAGDTGPVRANFWHRHKRGITVSVISVLTGGGIAGFLGASLFFGVTKIEGIDQEIDSVFSASVQQAEQKTFDHILQDYLVKHILPGVEDGLCSGTADVSRSCYVPGKSDGIFKTLYHAWAQKRLENQLAEKYSFELFKQDGKTYMKVGGVSKALTSSDIAALEDGTIDLADEAKVLGLVSNRVAVDDLLSLAGKDTTLWDRIFFRIKFGPLLEKKYGIKLCLFACDLQKKINAPIDDFKQFAKTAIYDNVLKPASQKIADAFASIIKGDDSGTKLQPTSDPTLPASTPAEDSVTQAFADAATNTEGALNGDLTQATTEATTELDGSVDKLVAEDAIKAVGGTATGDTASEAVDSVDPATWALIAAQIYRTAATAGEILQVYGYAIKAASAVKLYMMFKTTVSELQSGHIDPTVLGSFNNVLSTNVTGTAGDSSDATSTPLYAKLFGGGVDPSKTPYRCNDGSKVPSGQLVCPEEVFTAGNQTVSNISGFLNSIPVISQLATAINSVNGVIGDITNFLFGQACSIPGVSKACSTAADAIGQATNGLFQWLMNTLLPMPFTDHMSGGRTFDMLVAGADVANNKSCQVDLGCAKLNNQQIATIRSEQAAYEQRQFDALPLFARLFSTDTPYSLVSRVAVIWPTNLSDASAQLATFLGNPLSSMGHVVSSIFAGPRAFAASQPINDPFGVIQYGYTDDQIPADPETYWDQHCQNDPNFAINWENSQKQDPATGEAVATKPEPCLLIQSTVQSAGTFFDPSLAPDGSLNPDPQQ